MARSDGDFAHSLADLMSGVAVTFLVLAAIFMVQAAKATKRERETVRTQANKDKQSAAELEALKARNRRSMDILQKLGGELAGSDLVQATYDPQKDPYLLTLTLSRDRFRFASASCAMDGEQRESLLEVLRKVIPLVCGPLDKDLTRRIMIEGHTDRQLLLGGECPTVRPPRSCRRESKRASAECLRESFNANMRLSSERADYIRREASSLPFDEQVAHCLESDINVSGRGPVEPADGKPWREKRDGKQDEINRRVVIKVWITAPLTADELKSAPPAGAASP